MYVIQTYLDESGSKLSSHAVNEDTGKIIWLPPVLPASIGVWDKDLKQYVLREDEL